MNKPCNDKYGKIFYSSGMTLSNLHYDEDQVSKVFKKFMGEEEKYYNGARKETTVKKR